MSSNLPDMKDACVFKLVLFEPQPRDTPVGIMVGVSCTHTATQNTTIEHESVPLSFATGKTDTQVVDAAINVLTPRFAKWYAQFVANTAMLEGVPLSSELIGTNINI